MIMKGILNSVKRRMNNRDPSANSSETPQSQLSSSLPSVGRQTSPAVPKPSCTRDPVQPAKPSSAVAEPNAPSAPSYSLAGGGLNVPATEYAGAPHVPVSSQTNQQVGVSSDSSSAASLPALPPSKPVLRSSTSNASSNQVPHPGYSNTALSSSAAGTGSGGTGGSQVVGARHRIGSAGAAELLLLYSSPSGSSMDRSQQSDFSWPGKNGTSAASSQTAGLSQQQAGSVVPQTLYHTNSISVTHPPPNGTPPVPTGDGRNTPPGGSTSSQGSGLKREVFTLSQSSSPLKGSSSSSSPNSPRSSPPKANSDPQQPGVNDSARSKTLLGTQGRSLAQEEAAQVQRLLAADDAHPPSSPNSLMPQLSPKLGRAMSPLAKAAAAVGLPPPDIDLMLVRLAGDTAPAPAEANVQAGLGTVSSQALISVIASQRKPSATFGLLVAKASPDIFAKLPPLRVAGIAERAEVFNQKVAACGNVIFDFRGLAAVTLLEEKEHKRQTLLEMVDYLNSSKLTFTDALMERIVDMISANIFRALPPSAVSPTPLASEADELEANFEPSWAHLQVVYEFVLRFIMTNDVNPKMLKKYMDAQFVLRFLDLFSSEDPRERDYLKTILHRIYGKIMALRAFIRKAIQHIFLRFAYENGSFNGISELLEILGSIINGFALPLKEEHRFFLERSMIPLHKANGLAAYHQQLGYCMTQYVDKENKLAESIILGLLRYWPVTNTPKEVLFLNELEEILELTKPPEFKNVMEPLMKRLALCIQSPHFQIAERVLFLWNNERVIKLINQNREQLYPIIIGALYRNTMHWNQAVTQLTINVSKLMAEEDVALFDQCTDESISDEKRKEQRRTSRQQIWKQLKKSYEDRQGIVSGSPQSGSGSRLVADQGRSSAAASPPKAANSPPNGSPPRRPTSGSSSAAKGDERGGSPPNQQQQGTSSSRSPRQGEIRSGSPDPRGGTADGGSS